MSITGDRAILYEESDYIGLITNQHADKGRFVDTVKLSVAPFVEIQYPASFLAVTYYDVDAGYGAGLDALGKWVGITRYVAVPITGVYFEWGGTAAEGWGSGIWKGQFNPASGISELPDDVFRRLIRAKIIANRWDGTIDGDRGIYAVLAAAFPGVTANIIDNLDMTMDARIDGAALDSLSLALFMGGYLPIKPSGVGITYYDTL